MIRKKSETCHQIKVLDEATVISAGNIFLMSKTSLLEVLRGGELEVLVDIFMIFVLVVEESYLVAEGVPGIFCYGYYPKLILLAREQE